MFENKDKQIVSIVLRVILLIKELYIKLKGCQNYCLY